MWSGSDPIGCVTYSLCAYAWEVAECWNMSVMCCNSLNEDVAKLFSAVSQFRYSANIRFMCKVGNSAADMMRALQTVVYGDNAVNKTAVCYQYSHFNSGQELLEDESCSVRPSTSVNAGTVSELQELVYANWQITISEIAYEMGISYGSAHTILTEELQMRRFCAMFVLRLLSDYQVECFEIIASGLFDKSTQDGVLPGKVVTGD